MILLPLLALLAVDAQAGRVDLKASGPVAFKVDGQPVPFGMDFAASTAELGAGEHTVSVHSLFGKVLHEQTVRVPEEGVVVATWRKGNLTVSGEAPEPVAVPVVAAEPAPDAADDLPVLADAEPEDEGDDEVSLGAVGLVGAAVGAGADAAGAGAAGGAAAAGATPGGALGATAPPVFPAGGAPTAAPVAAAAAAPVAAVAPPPAAVVAAPAVGGAFAGGALALPIGAATPMVAAPPPVTPSAGDALRVTIAQGSTELTLTLDGGQLRLQDATGELDLTLAVPTERPAAGGNASVTFARADARGAVVMIDGTVAGAIPPGARATTLALPAGEREVELRSLEDNRLLHLGRLAVAAGATVEVQFSAEDAPWVDGAPDAWRPW